MLGEAGLGLAEITLWVVLHMGVVLHHLCTESQTPVEAVWEVAVVVHLHPILHQVCLEMAPRAASYCGIPSPHAHHVQ